MPGHRKAARYPVSLSIRHTAHDSSIDMSEQPKDFLQVIWVQIERLVTRLLLIDWKLACSIGNESRRGAEHREVKRRHESGAYARKAGRS